MKLFHYMARPPFVLALCRLPILFLCSICPLHLLAQEESASSQQNAYAVRGSVFNKSTHQPIARALVILQGQASGMMFTDNEGQFEFDNIAAGSLFLTVRRPGFVGSQPFSGQEMRTIRVGPKMADVNIALLPTGTIKGQITLSTADSAEKIQVHLLYKSIQGGRSYWQQMRISPTNSEGVYSFTDLSPGTYRIVTSASIDPDPDPMHSQQRWGFTPEYFPGKEDTAAILLHAGEQVEADLMLTHEPFYPVLVSVASGSLRRGANLQVYDDAGHLQPFPTRYDPREQAVHLDLPKGTYLLESQSFGEMPMFGRAEVTMQNAPLNVAVPLLPLHPLPVTIRRDFTSQNSASNISVISGGSTQPDWISAGVNLMLRQLTGGNSGLASGNLRHVPGSSDNSSFILENVRPGTYLVQTNSFQGYVASISSGGVDLAQKPLVIGPGGTSPAIEIVLRNDGASLGITQNQSAGENGASPAYLSIVPEFATTWQPPEHLQLTQSSTVLSNLPPGTYRIFAFDVPQQLEYNNPEAMRPYVGKGQTVTLEPGASTQVSVDVISTSSQSQ